MNVTFNVSFVVIRTFRVRLAGAFHEQKCRDMSDPAFKLWPAAAVNRDGFTFVAHPNMRKTVSIALVAVLLLMTGCDRFAELLELPNPGRENANAEAIGSACRQTGRSIEDCYALNPDVQKAAIFAGWKSMNGYMMEHNLKEVPSVVSRTETQIGAPQAAAH